MNRRMEGKVRVGNLRFMLAGLVVSGALIVTACGGDDDDSTTADPTAPGQSEIAVTMSDELLFDPDEIEARVGQPVQLSFQNSGTTLHDFTVEEIEVEDVMSEGSQASPTGGHGMATATAAPGGHGGDTSSEYDLHVAVDGGSSGMLEFTPTEAGEYEFICTVTGHAEGGMAGTLIVSD